MADNIREPRSKGRRSSILKRQDTGPVNEGAIGLTEFGKTSRRVSFANTAIVRTFDKVPWQFMNSSCSDDNNSHINNTSIDDTEDNVFLPSVEQAVEPERCNQPIVKENSQIMSVPDVLESINQDIRVDNMQDQTIYFSNLNNSDDLELTANISQLPYPWTEQMLDNNYTAGPQLRLDRIPSFSEEEAADGEDNSIFFNLPPRYRYPPADMVTNDNKTLVFNLNTDNGMDFTCNAGDQNMRVPHENFVANSTKAYQEDMEMTGIIPPHFSQYKTKNMTPSVLLRNTDYSSQTFPHPSSQLQALNYGGKSQFDGIENLTNQANTEDALEDMDMTGEQSHLPYALGDLKALTPIEELSLSSTNVSQGSKVQVVKSQKLNFSQLRSRLVDSISSTAHHHDKENWPVISLGVNAPPTSEIDPCLTKNAEHSINIHHPTVRNNQSIVANAELEKMHNPIKETLQMYNKNGHTSHGLERDVSVKMGEGVTPKDVENMNLTASSNLNFSTNSIQEQEHEAGQKTKLFTGMSVEFTECVGNLVMCDTSTSKKIHDSEKTNVSSNMSMDLTEYVMGQGTNNNASKSQGRTDSETNPNFSGFVDDDRTKYFSGMTMDLTKGTVYSNIKGDDADTPNLDYEEDVQTNYSFNTASKSLGENDNSEKTKTFDVSMEISTCDHINDYNTDRENPKTIIFEENKEETQLVTEKVNGFVSEKTLNFTDKDMEVVSFTSYASPNVNCNKTKSKGVLDVDEDRNDTSMIIKDSSRTKKLFSEQEHAVNPNLHKLSNNTVLSNRLSFSSKTNPKSDMERKKLLLRQNLQKELFFSQPSSRQNSFFMQGKGGNYFALDSQVPGRKSEIIEKSLHRELTVQMDERTAHSPNAPNPLHSGESESSQPPRVDRSVFHNLFSPTSSQIIEAEISRVMEGSKVTSSEVQHPACSSTHTQKVELSLNNVSIPNVLSSLSPEIDHDSSSLAGLVELDSPSFCMEAKSQSEDITGDSCMLMDQMMPDLQGNDVMPAIESFDYGKEAILLSYLEQSYSSHEKQSNSKEKATGENKSFNRGLMVSDIYAVMGLNDVEPFSQLDSTIEQSHESSSLEGQLERRLFITPQVTCLQDYSNKLEAEIKRMRNSLSSMIEQLCASPPPKLLNIVSSPGTAQKEISEINSNAHFYAKTQLNKLQADYLLNLTSAHQGEESLLKTDLSAMVADNERIQDMQEMVDKSKAEMDIVIERQSELQSLEQEAQRTEDKLVSLRSRSKQLDNAIEQSNKTVLECQQRKATIEEDHSLLQERLGWMTCLCEWTLLKNGQNDLTFGFFYDTISVNVEFVNSEDPHRPMTNISVKSMISSDNPSFVVVAQKLMMKNINGQALKQKYGYFDQLNQLLNEVSESASVHRDLVKELRTIDLLHQVKFEECRLKVRMFNSRRAWEVEIGTDMAQCLYPFQPLKWTVNVLGSLSSDSIHSALNNVTIGEGYLTRTLEAVSSILE